MGARLAMLGLLGITGLGIFSSTSARADTFDNPPVVDVHYGYGDGCHRYYEGREWHRGWDRDRDWYRDRDGRRGWDRDRDWHRDYNRWDWDRR